MKNGIALFDFDGTITTRDTLLEFIKFSFGNRRFYFGFLWNLHYLVAYRLNIISNQLAKEKIFKFFFRNISVDRFEQMCSRFTNEALPALIRKKAVNEIFLLKNKGFEIVVVSASPQDWIKTWTNSNGLTLIASILEVRNNRLTGKIDGKNCHGNEKVRRIKEKIDLSAYKEIYAYGDSSGDKPMLALATYSFYRPFRN